MDFARGGGHNVKESPQRGGVPFKGQKGIYNGTYAVYARPLDGDLNARHAPPPPQKD